MIGPSAEVLDERIAIIGTGYVGIVTGACLASKGMDVTCVDLDNPEGREKVDAINEGRSPIVEDKLEGMIRKTVNQGNLRATTDIGKAVRNSSIVLISVGTPSAVDGSANLEYVFDAASSIAKHARPETIVAIRSTVPVGTTRRIGQLLASQSSTRLHTVSNPEFLAEGTAVDDTMRPSRIVIGTDLPDEIGKRMSRMWHPFLLNPARHDLLIMDPESSETVKLNSNFQLALQIIGTNTVAEMCERTGADYRMVQAGTGKDPRIGKFLNPGPGYGGSCFPKDVRALAFLASQLGVESKFLQSLNETNEWHKSRWFEKIKDFYAGDLKGKKIAVWGLSFKPGTDDVRESAAMTIIPSLLDEGAHVVAFDPLAKETATEVLGEHPGALDYVEDKYAALESADALLLLTDSGEYTHLDTRRALRNMRVPAVFDTRRIWEPTTMKAAGFYFDSNGSSVVDGRAA